MRKLFIVFLLLSLAVFTACSNGEKNTSQENNEQNNANNTIENSDGVLAKIKEKGELNVGTEGTYAPFSYHDDSGKLTGYDIEVIEEIAKRLDLKINFHETQWDAIFAGLDAGRFDLIANQVGINEERKEKYSFTQPYTRSNAVLIIHEDNDDITSFAEIEGKVAAQTLTSNYGQLAESYGAKLEKVDGFNQAIDLVISKRVDGTFNDKISALDFKKQRPEAKVKIVDEAKDASENAFVFRQDSADLVEAIDEILTEMREDGTLKSISEKWFGEDVS